MQLAKKLRAVDYFALGFGAMVGVGWLVVMDDWLERGGPLGAILGFALCGAALLPIGYVYGRLAGAMPDAGSEIAYTAQFGDRVSFAAGWMMMLAYLVVCPWEAIAIGKIASYLLPSLSTIELYQVAGKPVYLPHLVAGIGLTAWITLVNYRGIRWSARFQNVTTFSVLALFAVACLSALGKGSVANMKPAFSGGAVVSTLLVLQVVPYFMTGFEAVPKCAEEASPGFGRRGFFLAIFCALGVGVLFYTLAVAVVSSLTPWRSLLHTPFATAVAFERALSARWIVDILLAAALLSLLKVFNGNFLAASRLLFALGRRGLATPRLAWIHPKNQTPAVAVAVVGAVTVAFAPLGQAVLIPIAEVGSFACTLGWLAACVAWLRMGKGVRERAIAVTGIVVATSLSVIKLIPWVPGHFSKWEWIALAAWALVGLAIHRKRPAAA